MPPFSVVAGWGKEGGQGALLVREGDEVGREKPRVKTEACREGRELCWWLGRYLGD